MDCVATGVSATGCGVGWLVGAMLGVMCVVGIALEDGTRDESSPSVVTVTVLALCRDVPRFSPWPCCTAPKHKRNSIL